MDVTAEDFRRHYAELSDEALLEVDTAELVPIARTCHAEEVVRRGLDAVPAADDSPDDKVAGTEEPTEELVCIADYDYRDEAELARGLLEAASIPATLETEQGESVQAMPEMNLAGTVSGVRLMVPKALAEQALQILATPLSDEELAAQAEAAGLEDEDQDA